MNLESLASTVPEEQEAEGEAGDDGSAQGAGGVGKDEHRSSVAFLGVPSGGAIPGGGILRSVGAMDHPGSRVEQAVCPRKTRKSSWFVEVLAVRALCRRCTAARVCFVLAPLRGLTRCGTMECANGRNRAPIGQVVEAPCSRPAKQVQTPASGRGAAW